MRFDHQQAFAPYLLPGERLLWSGAPHQGIVLRSDDMWLIPVSLLFCSVIIVWNVGVWSTGAPSAFILFGTAFLALGLYVLLGRFLHDAIIRRRHLYAVSNRRILRLDRKPSARFSSLDLAALPGLELQEHADGAASILFDPRHSPFGLWLRPGFEFWVPSVARAINFYRIPDGRDVHRMVARLRTGENVDAPPARSSASPFPRL